MNSDSYLEYEISEDSILLKSYPKLGEDGYIGRIAGEISSADGTTFALTNQEFRIFADDDFVRLDLRQEITIILIE